MVKVKTLRAVVLAIPEGATLEIDEEKAARFEQRGFVARVKEDGSTPPPAKPTRKPSTRKAKP
jgi:hypothetical protein